MVEELVVDANVLVAALSDEDPLHQEAFRYRVELEAGQVVFHLPTLALVEICCAINRYATTTSLLRAMRAQETLLQWEHDGKIRFYELSHDRMMHSVTIALRDRIPSGADAIYAAISSELSIPLKTFDRRLARRYQGLVSP